MRRRNKHEVPLFWLGRQPNAGLDAERLHDYVAARVNVWPTLTTLFGTPRVRHNARVMAPGLRPRAGKRRLPEENVVKATRRRMHTHDPGRLWRISRTLCARFSVSMSAKGVCSV